MAKRAVVSTVLMIRSDVSGFYGAVLAIKVGFAETGSSSLYEELCPVNVDIMTNL